MTQTGPFQAIFAAIPVTVLLGLAVAWAQPAPDSSHVDGFRSHLPSFGLLEDFRLQIERTPKVRSYYDGEGQQAFRPSYYFVMYPGHLWLGQLSLAKDFRSWLVFQAWMLTEFGSEGDPQRPEDVEVRERKPVFSFETRVVARF